LYKVLIYSTTLHGKEEYSFIRCEKKRYQLKLGLDISEFDARAVRSGHNNDIVRKMSK
jgi:hypothetical protein